jgi:predicted aspartyl protease
VNPTRRALLVALGACAAAATRARDGEPAPTADGVAGPLYATPTRLDGVGRIVVPVMLNGRGPYRFLLDTGANRSAISPQLAAELDLPAGAPVRLRGVTGSAVAGTARVERLEAGAVRLAGTDLAVVAPPVFARAEGILGVDGLAGKRVDIDFAADRVAITESNRRDAAPGFFVIPARRRFGQLLVAEGRVANVGVRAVIDTGAERSLGNLALQRRLIRRARSRTERVEAQVYGATEELQSGQLLQVPPISIGELELTNLAVTFGDLHVFEVWDLQRTPALVVGMDLLGTVSRLVIDYRLTEIHVRPAAPSRPR